MSSLKPADTTKDTVQDTSMDPSVPNIHVPFTATSGSNESVIASSHDLTLNSVPLSKSEHQPTTTCVKTEIDIESSTNTNIREKESASSSSTPAVSAPASELSESKSTSDISTSMSASSGTQTQTGGVMCKIEPASESESKPALKPEPASSVSSSSSYPFAPTCMTVNVTPATSASTTPRSTISPVSSTSSCTFNNSASSVRAAVKNAHVPKGYYLITLPPDPIGVIVINLERSTPTQVLVVEKKNPTSPLESGDVIVAIQMTAITSVPQLAEILQGANGGRRVAIVERAMTAMNERSLVKAHSSIVPEKVIHGNGNAYYTYEDIRTPSILGRPTQTSSVSAKKNTKKAAKRKSFSSKHKLDLAKNAKAQAKGTEKKAASNTKASSKKKQKIIKLPHVPLYEEDMPKPGFLSSNRAYYNCVKNDSYAKIAKYIGLDDWKQLSVIEFNVKRYNGIHTARAEFYRNSIIRIPTHLCSKWKMDKLVDDEKEQLQVLATCSKCHDVEKDGDDENGNPMLMCDGCDLTIHLKCAGLTSVPTGDWLCHSCLDVLKARREAYDEEAKREMLMKDGHRSMEAELPKLEELDSETRRLATMAQHRFFRAMIAKKRYFFDQSSFGQTIPEQPGDRPCFLGVVCPNDDSEVQALNMLREPIELVCAIPIDGNVDNHEIEITSGIEYYLFGTGYLFCPERNDYLPINFSHRTSVRNAQRQLMTMLLREPRNKCMQMTETNIPSSVNVRGTATEDTGAVVKCFDLSQLVRDCNCPIQDQPSAKTPQRLAEHGLVLRDYQKASLQWMIDKENDTTGLGTAGELWARMRPLDASNDGYFYSHLTGSIVRDIFKYATDVDQKDAANPCGKFPTGGILGEEMGLGKTVIAIALVVASPPPKHNRILPREYIASIQHPAYLSPPSPLACTSARSKFSLTSNATLVIAPMTLCSQWQKEIERFAPFLSVLTLHNDENPSEEEIASKDMIVVSTFLLLNKATSTTLLGKLRKIHFHRIFLDESHYNNTGERMKLSLASISATHRYCVTGTPVGHSLQDLYGQLRFLRVPQFCRPEFWKYNIEKAYSDRNYDALQVLRSLLSHLIVRHSKEQTFDNGKSLLTLPSRTMETLLLPFGSDAEKNVYEYIENRNLQRFKDLRSESPNSVLGRYIELCGMMFGSRQVCAHPCLIDIDKMQALAESIQYENRVKNGYMRACGKKAAAERKKHGNATRSDIIEEADSKAIVSARGRMREIVLRFQEGEMEFVECPMCLEPIGEKDVALTPCAHPFCSECILTVLTSASSSREPQGPCAVCRQSYTRSKITFLGDAKEAGEKVSNQEDRKIAANEIGTENNVNGFRLSTKDILSSVTGASDERFVCDKLNDSERRTQRAFCSELAPEFLDAWNTASTAVGTKIARLLEEIKIMIRNDADSKCVVFSQFLGTLDIASQEMIARGVKFVRVDGGMKQHQRADAIESFTTDANTRVLLISMKAGAAGLNLMAANHCFLMDATMNSALEEQAIDRIHRIGQTRPVIVKRFIMKDTIEERILSNRRAILADQPSASTQLDGTSALLEEERILNRPQKRARHGDESELDNQAFQRLERLEALFGFSGSNRISKA